MPDFPSQMFFQDVTTPIPVGLTVPNPVITTLLFKRSNLPYEAYVVTGRDV